jgi:hypothetical protein
MDEQHSRSQRSFGCAPYCTSTFLNQNSLICEMTSVDDEAVTNTTILTKAGTPAKSKAKISHCLGMQAIVEAFGGSNARLVHFCADQSSDGMSDADIYLRSQWDFRQCFDIWHKVKDFNNLWKTFCTRRLCPRGITFGRLLLSVLFPFLYIFRACITFPFVILIC